MADPAQVGAPQLLALVVGLARGARLLAARLHLRELPGLVLLEAPEGLLDRRAHLGGLGLRQLAGLLLARALDLALLGRLGPERMLA